MSSICNEFEDELHKRNPRMKRLNAVVKTACRKLLGYIAVESHVLIDSTRQTVVIEDFGVEREYFVLSEQLIWHCI